MPRIKSTQKNGKCKNSQLLYLLCNFGTFLSVFVVMNTTELADKTITYSERFFKEKLKLFGKSLKLTKGSQKLFVVVLPLCYFCSSPKVCYGLGGVNEKVKPLIENNVFPALSISLNINSQKFANNFNHERTLRAMLSVKFPPSK